MNIPTYKGCLSPAITAPRVICALLALYTAGYLLGPVNDETNVRSRGFSARWQCAIYLPAARIEGLSIGRRVLVVVDDGRRALVDNLKQTQIPAARSGGSISKVREFAPEWTNVQIPNTRLIGYRKELTLTVVHHGNTANCGIPLERDGVTIQEVDGNPGFIVTWHYPRNLNVHRITERRGALAAATTLVRFGHIKLRTKVDGSPAWHDVRFLNSRHLDLNGDGVFDVFDSYAKDDNGNAFIFYSDQLIHVKGHGRGFGLDMRTAHSLTGSVYVFAENGVWRPAQPGLRSAPVEYPSNEARAFGPEWTKIPIPGTQEFDHRKELKVPVVYRAGVTEYTVQLEQHRLLIEERDDNRGFAVTWQENGRIDVRRKRDGTPEWNAVRFPNARYLDLNGDGIFDVFVDFREDREGEVFILLDQRFIRVKGSSGSVNETLRSAAAADGRRYAFERDSWRLAP